MNKFEKRVELFKRILKSGKIKIPKKYSKEMIEEMPVVLADMTFNRDDREIEFILYLFGLESYFLYKPEIRKRDICHNANSKNCAKCHEPECDLAKGWMKKAENNEKCEKCGYKFDGDEFDDRACPNCGAKRK